MADQLSREAFHTIVIGGGLLGFARRRGWIAGSFLQLGVVALPLFCGLASEAVATSMFIAAFVAGLAVQVGAHYLEKMNGPTTEDHDRQACRETLCR